MYYFVTISQLMSFLISLGFDVSTFTEYEKCSIWVLSNILILIFIILALSIVYKFICKISSWL